MTTTVLKKGMQSMDVQRVWDGLIVDGVAVIATSNDFFLGTREVFGVAWKVTNPNPSDTSHIQITYQTSVDGVAGHWTNESVIVADEVTEIYQESSLAFSPTQYIKFIVEGITGNPTSGGMTLDFWFISQD